jgi:rhodanese-related sulfurtransferase
MSPKPSPRFRRIGAADAADLILRHRRRVLPELALYDVRDRASYDLCHVDGAEHLGDAGVRAAVLLLPKRTPVVLYCYRGHASQRYAATFADARFAEVYSVDGGFEPLAAELARREDARPSAPDGELSAALVSFLVHHGFDRARLDAPREHGLTPLMRAALAGRAEIVDELVRVGVDVGQRNADGNNALWLGCVSNDLGVVERLVQAGIPIDNRNDAGATALMYAASSGKAEIVELLLRAGADPHAQNQDDFTALDLASTWSCLALLRRAGEPRRAS